MTGKSPDSALARMGANERGAPSGYNLDVSGTVGPGYLGQETTDVDGHPQDRPGVLSRLPESTGGDDPRIRMMDTGEDLPVLLESNMRADPIEGTQGSYTEIIEGECARCGYDRLKVSVATMPGERQQVCNACGAIQNHRDDDGYRMPRTRKERAKRKREAGPTIGSITNREVVDLEPDAGYGPMVCLARDRSFTSLFKDDVADLFWMLVENDDLDLADEIEAALKSYEVAALAVRLLPDGWGVRPPEDEDSDE